MPYEFPSVEWTVHHLLTGCIVPTQRRDKHPWPYRHADILIHRGSAHCTVCGKETVLGTLPWGPKDYAESIHY